MALMLDNIGLEFLNDDNDAFTGLVGMVAQEGKPFPGYSGGANLFKKTGSCEFWLHIQKSTDAERYEVTGVHSHGGNKCIWELCHTGIGLSSSEGTVMEHIAMFRRADGTGGIIPIDIINADVLPSLMENDKITVQVVGYPLDINYYKDDEEYETAHTTTFNNQKWTLAKGAFMPLAFLTNHNPDTYEEGNEYPSDAYVSFTAEVQALYHGTFKIGEKEDNAYIRCFVETPFGQFELAHTIDQVPEEQRSNIRIGAIVSGVCIISGDVALNEYENGAVKDFEHDLRLLRYVMQEGKAEKLAGVLAEKTVYSSEASNMTVVGTKDIIDRMNYVHENRKKDERFYVHCGTITTRDSEELDYPVGTRCLILAEGKENHYISIVFLKVNEDGIIDNIEVSTDSRYHFQTDVVEKPHNPLDDLELPASVAEAILLRAKYNGILDWDTNIEGFVDRIDDYHELEDPVDRMIKAIKQDLPESPEETAENVLGYLFAKAAECEYNRSRANLEMRTKLIASYCPTDAYKGIIHAADESIQDDLDAALNEGKRYYIDFKVHSQDNEDMEGIFKLAAIVVEKLGQIYGQRIIDMHS